MLVFSVHPYVISALPLRALRLCGELSVFTHPNSEHLQGACKVVNVAINSDERHLVMPNATGIG